MPESKLVVVSVPVARPEALRAALVARNDPLAAPSARHILSTEGQTRTGLSTDLGHLRQGVRLPERLDVLFVPVWIAIVKHDRDREEDVWPPGQNET